VRTGFHLDHRDESLGDVGGVLAEEGHHALVVVAVEVTIVIDDVVGGGGGGLEILWYCW
jgi:hypothetical protein